MRYKLLSVDDSKTVRIIIKKAFKLYDVEIFEAANGVEGLALAAKEIPDVILLDVTMPVMDGVEMLTKLKGDPRLKAIPVVMLTAEGGKDHVLKIAKIGVRDYIVKPFKEEVLVQKVGRIIDLKPISDAPAKAKSIFDSANLLIVEDKPAIVAQIQEGLKHTPWQVHGVATTGEAIDYCGRNTADFIMISLSLADDAAATLFRVLRANLKTKYTPIFGLAVKTDSNAQQQAQQVGFTGIATKPIDMAELEAKVAKAMNLDTSERYFSTDVDLLLMKLPELCTPNVVNEITGYLKGKVADAVDSGINKVVFDLQEVKRLDMVIIKLLLTAMQSCREVALQYTLMGNAAIVAESKGYEDTRGWQFHENIEAARQSFQKAPVAV
ncbi:MAG: response regulator [Verrucomicrobia bacterium]|nr:response regulator [Verrucomicrobiota bacterium]